MSRDTTFDGLADGEPARAASRDLVMDEDAFCGFYTRHARPLWAFLVHVTGDRQLADDLLQETFYRFLRAAAPYENEAHRRHSLFRIAANLARDAHRRSAVRRFITFARPAPESLAGADPGPAAERAADLARALKSLKPRERAMLWLAYAEGASHHEIAAALGLRPSSLKALLFRARRKLASLLAGAPDRGVS